MKFIYNYRPYILLIFITLFIFTLGLIFRADSSRITIDKPLNFNDGWILLEENSFVDLDVLPIDLNLGKSVDYTISNTLNSDFSQSQVLLIRTSLQNISIKVNDEVIYERSYQVDTKFPPYASMWHFVSVPEQSAGSEIEITLSSPYLAMSGIVNEIYYGSHAMLYNHLLTTYGYRLAVGLIVLIMGIIMMTLSLFLYKKDNYKNTYIGLFATLLSLWMIAESRMIQWITGNQMIIGSLAYLMLALFPIPILYYLKNYVIKTYRNPYNVLIVIFYVQSVLIVLLHAFTLYDFFETVAYTQIWLLIGFFVVLVTLAIEIVKFKDKDSIKVAYLLGVMTFFAILEIINFFFNNFRVTSTFTLTGVGIVMLILFINYLSYLIKRLKISYEGEFYEKLAFQDWLTGGKNRLKFEQDFDLMFSEEEVREKIRLVYFDFDDLKKVNDEYGHLEGDYAIKKGFQLITDIFGEKGTCYRVGGDEFACLVTNMDHKAFLARSKKLRDEVEQFSQGLKYPFRISIGTASYHATVDLSPKDLIKRADDDMYLDKCTFKDNCVRKKESTL